MPFRNEKKYLVPTNKLENIRKRLDTFVQPDYFGEQNDGFPEYTVRSIYFDSFQKNAYQEKVDGIKERKKLRIRAYGDYYNGCKVFLEIKRKVEYMVIKNRAFVSYDQIENILLFGNIEDYFSEKDRKQIDDGIRFLFNLKKYNQNPTNLIVYEREAYFGKFNKDVRITFDKNIRSMNNPLLSDLFNETNLKPLWKNKFILEIKYFSGIMPIWLRSIVQEFKLKNESLSKYMQGVDETRNL
jgi:SPX domain protein involved in polyphosphate accumulation